MTENKGKERFERLYVFNSNIIKWDSLLYLKILLSIIWHNWRTREKLMTLLLQKVT